ncbi:MAG: SOS response-associated peptidase, partial [Phycisphaerales bacterium]|nr:SOS response-associated peptidase [Phycisphaerales bacterium]
YPPLMCGRFTYQFDWRLLARLMHLVRWQDVQLTPRFNVAPTQDAPVIRRGVDGVREGVLLRWGLVPSWSDDAAIGNRLVNARSETVASKPAFRDAFAKRRCLVPVSGFYEWRTLADGKAKQPYLISRADREPMAFAGLWEHATIGGQPLETFTILTTSSNPQIAALHDRMPVLVSADRFDLWLSPARLSEGDQGAFFAPNPWPGTEMNPVSRLVNNPRIDTPEVAVKVPETDQSSGFLF